MKFDELDARMRVYETAHDHCVLPGIWMVVRLDGRNFTRLTKDICEFERPFDIRFRDLMADTVEHLMNSGFRVIYGYTESDEISLLLHPKDESFGRKLRKVHSVLAGEASAFFSLKLGRHACFDARVSQLPRLDDVRDYFRWRHEDAHRNSLSAHCYWSLRKEGKTARQATKEIEGLSVAKKNQLLFERGLNFNELPRWQRRGLALIWKDYKKEALNPKTAEIVFADRRRLERDFELPVGDAYGDYVLSQLRTSL
jgi:tRNA(His) guanylyltransferase